MTKILLVKSHIKAHTRKDGVFVDDYDTKTVKKMTYFEKYGSKGSSQGAFPGFSAPQKSFVKPEGYHPKENDKGERVGIYKQSSQTPLSSFDSADQIATVVPGGTMPAELNGVPFERWADAPDTLRDWADVDGQVELDEPRMDVHPKMKQGSGVIVQEPDGRVWVIHPTNSFGGYQGSFPKGTLEDGLSLQASAIKEAYEESGLKVEIVDHLMDVTRTTSVARYYLARRVGGTPSDAGWESQAVSLVPVGKLYEVLNKYTDHGLAEAIGAGKPPKDKINKNTLPLG